jgi:hypothetical protein
MTPDAIITQARQRYNAVGDSFFGDTELYNLIWQAEQDLALRTFCLQDTQSTTTVASQHEYARPTNAISVKRVTYNGRSLAPIDFQTDDALTDYDAASSNTGEPMYYYEWESSIFLRPTPNAAQTLKVWFYARPQSVTTGTTLELAEEYHLMLCDYILQHMFGKDGKNDMATYHMNQWEASVGKIKQWERRKRRSNQPAAVKNIDALADTLEVL